jgi:hypothetical protein
MATQTGGYPSLETVMNLARVMLNDFQNSGAGLITTDTSPQTLPALNSAIRWLYRKLRNVGDPSLIRDNVQRNLPATTVVGPTVQNYLSFDGFYDGTALQGSPTLPADLMFPLELWEQQTNSNLPFVLMNQPQAGLPSVWQQTTALGMWEWRGGAQKTAGTGGSDALFFVGATVPVTIRIRYQAALTQYTGTVDFANSYIPIMDCEEAVAYYFAYNIARTLTGITPAIADLKQSAEDALADLKLEQVRRAQTVNYEREAYGTGVTGSYLGVNNLI